MLNPSVIKFVPFPGIDVLHQLHLFFTCHKILNDGQPGNRIGIEFGSSVLYLLELVFTRV